MMLAVYHLHIVCYVLSVGVLFAAVNRWAAKKYLSDGETVTSPEMSETFQTIVLVSESQHKGSFHHCRESGGS